MNDSSVLPLMLRDKVQKTGSAVFRVTGGSMMPAIWPHSRIMVKKVRFSDLCAGDVICYITARGLHCHRVIAVILQEGLCFTLGDSFPDAQPEIVKAHDLVGRVEGIGIGRYWMRYSSPEFRILSTISTKTGKILRKIVHNTLFLPVVGPIARRIIARLKTGE